MSKKIIFLAIIIMFMLMTTSPIYLEATVGPDYNCLGTRQLWLREPKMEGYDILELQRELKALGFYEGELSSIYDQTTHQAVRRFQLANGLPATGMVKDQTWAQITQVASQSLLQTTAQHLKEPEGEVSLLIDGYRKEMIVYSDGKIHHKFPVAVGKSSTKSPIGEWAIITKDADWGGGFGDRWMRLNVPWGIYGIHGTNKPHSIGTAASHGCIRMFNRDVKVLYNWVEVGTRVKIIGNRDPIEITHNLRPGQTGRDVLLFQEKLREHGFDPGYTDGRFGEGTQEAIKDFKYIYGLEDNLIADDNTFYILGIK
ncbi:peptidoglycan-binding protein [Natroniella sulfidigena]|uniref:L,D-transpeptidase family protein n=1 Tax=Natroniella sulfidigena TaxID=723921 RepID=UPI002009EC61|nr:peptidoglycan-binding protein [Natroniella sulfidigena]MCK8817287.1 peptidoglycan-binding protein [Natroniella sulfidigena]